MSRRTMWRLLALRETDPYGNMAIEETLLAAVDGGKSPDTFRLWMSTPSVVLGWSQRPEIELNLENCRRFNVSVVRRFTGGGAVYHDLGNLNWTFVCRKSSWSEDPRGIIPLFRSFSARIVESLRALGLSAEFRAPNAICLGDSKVSGMAMYIKRQSILCHGTLLVESDLNVMRSVLKRMKDPVANVKDEARLPLSLTDVATTLRRDLTDALGIQCIEDDLSTEEKEMLRSVRFLRYDPFFQKGE